MTRIGRHGVGAAVTLLVGVLVSGAVVWRGTAVAFTATTTSAANTWTVGAVSLAEDHAGSAVFAESALLPGATGEKCVAVTSSGSAPGAVRLHASGLSDPGGVASHLTLTVEEGTGTAAGGTCTGGFARSGWLHTGTLDDLVRTRTDWSTGAGTWQPPAGTATEVYRFRWTLDPAAPDTLQGRAVSVTLTWELRT